MAQVVKPGLEVETDGRILAVDVCGDELGEPVVLLHGTPGSRNGPRPRASVLYRLGIRLISFDRPGYGGSTRKAGRRVVDTVADIETIMDRLGHDRFGVVGRSGGGPHALACAANLTDRVTRVAAMVSLAPAEADGLDWFGGMTEGNVSEYSTADADIAELRTRLEQVAKRTEANPVSILEDLLDELTGADRRIVRSPQVRGVLADTYAEALRHGANGWVDDVLAAREDWGFDLESIAVPVLLWHGEDDNLSPVSHTRWLGSRIPNARVCIQPGSAHFAALDALTDTLAWAAGATDRVPASSPEPARSERVRVKHAV